MLSVYSMHCFFFLYIIPFEEYALSNWNGVKLMFAVGQSFNIDHYFESDSIVTSIE